MTKKKEKEEDVLEAKAYQKEVKEEMAEIEKERIEKEKKERGAHAEEAAEKPAAKKEKKMIEESAEEKERKMQEYLDGWKRCQADFENYKKRQAEAQKETARYAAEKVILELLPVVDNFYASIDHAPEEQRNNPWVTGIMHIRKQLENILKENGLEEIAVKAGDDFDPRIHEAVKKEESGERQEGSEFENKIAGIIQKGYRMGSKVIRPARVIVE